MLGLWKPRILPRPQIQPTLSQATATPPASRPADPANITPPCPTSVGIDPKTDLPTVVQGEVDFAPATLETYSHDASLFEVKPEVVVFPKDVADVSGNREVRREHKSNNANLSVTAAVPAPICPAVRS